MKWSLVRCEGVFLFSLASARALRIWALVLFVFLFLFRGMSLRANILEVRAREPISMADVVTVLLS